MPNAQRIIVSLEPPLRLAIKALADRDSMSVSSKARDLLRRAVEVDEDEALEAMVASRMRTGKGAGIPHTEFWRTVRRRATQRTR